MKILVIVFFPNKQAVIGEQIIIRNIPSTIIGVVAEQKSTFGDNKSLRVWVPYSTLSSRIYNRSYLDNITVKVKEGYDASVAEQQILRLLTIRHGKKDIFTYNIDSFIKAAEKNHANYATVFNLGSGYFAGGRRDRRDEYHVGFCYGKDSGKLVFVWR
ncbi:macrolide transporter ATP-binding /permease protein [Proteus mirabilis]|uniref:Macrolide transporter ATP-binding /permease protein n=1 Tax=Proteus mirabilis TaxID=584 RepID=A0A2X2BI84_PROMI|nr:macrolide transporter ATP-binding /permease protein [Proteus mirabilis]